MRFIYARVSTAEQNVDQQVAELVKKYGKAGDILTDKASGKDMDRPAMQKLIDKVRTGDTVIVADISRLGRNVLDVLTLVDQFDKKGVHVIVDALGSVDVTSAAGKIVLSTLAAVAEMQRVEMLDKQSIGIARAKLEGKYKGRSADVRLHSQILELLAGGMSMRKVAVEAGCSLSTVQRTKKAA